MIHWSEVVLLAAVAFRSFLENFNVPLGLGPWSGTAQSGENMLRMYRYLGILGTIWFVSFVLKYYSTPFHSQMCPELGVSNNFLKTNKNVLIIKDQTR